MSRTVDRVLVTLPPGYTPAHDDKTILTRAIYSGYRPYRPEVEDAYRAMMGQAPARKPDPADEAASPNEAVDTITSPGAGETEADTPEPRPRTGAPAVTVDSAATSGTDDHDGYDEAAALDDDADSGDDTKGYDEHDVLIWETDDDGRRIYLYAVPDGKGALHAATSDKIELANSKGDPIVIDENGHAVDGDETEKPPLKQRMRVGVAKLKARINGDVVDDNGDPVELDLYDEHGVPITDFDIPKVGEVKTLAGRRRGRQALALTTGGALLVGAVALILGVSMGRSAVPAAGMVSAEEAANYRLTDFPIVGAAAFGEQYLQVCLNHGDSDSVKIREQILEAMATSGAADACGWVSGGDIQSPQMITWNGSMTPISGFPHGEAAYLGYTVALDDGVYQTVTVPVWVKTTKRANDMKIIGDIGITAPHRLAQPPAAKAPNEFDSKLANEVEDSIVLPYLIAWSDSDQRALNLVTTDDATPDAMTGLGGQVSNPQIEKIAVQSPRKKGTSDGSEVVYEDGDTVMAEVQVRWDVAASKSTQIAGYRLELTRKSGKWLVYDVQGGLVDRKGSTGGTGMGSEDTFMSGLSND